MKLVEIQSIKEITYKGDVYDLAVEEDHSYNVDGIIVHNSMCSTRIETGHGIPNISAIVEVLRETTVPIIADGGIRTAGDIAKAIAAGADTAMLGSLLAGTVEAPGSVIETSDGLYKQYRGSASLETKSANNQETRNIEGVSTTVPFKGGVKYVINRLTDGLRSSCSYSGSETLDIFKAKSRLVRITHAGQIEATPHLTR